MMFPDQSHINRVRDALWQQPEGSASVMVGAGFSRNAVKFGPQAREFPLWNQVTEALCSRLYPSNDGGRLQNAIAEASGTSGFLRLAQEYEVAFGRGELHRLIKVLVPDDDYVPAEIHARLLRLPWRDVFTTNWDTVLERARPQAADRAYSIVRTPEEIPSSQRPRIVKLHGSFPAHIPFIFTEEDYRSYPTCFAPFVNTVQQAMMETVVLLVGFSGDDPNFLHWSGWVRDNLGKLAPKVYLAGWLDLSPHRRRMLEERNVVPIDLARHPQSAAWPDHLRHQYSTEWILHTLEHGQPYDVSEWPSPHELRRSSVPELLHPVEDPILNAPVQEPYPKSDTLKAPDLLHEVRGIIEAWQHNRKTYPGWLFIPPEKHRLLEISVDHWERAILQALPELEVMEQLSMLGELTWRQEKLLEPIDADVERAIVAVLDRIDCVGKKLDGEPRSGWPWTNIRASWCQLRMALATQARRRLDRVEFEKHIAALHPFLGDHPDILHRVCHERCLWLLNEFDYDALEKELSSWNTDNSDPSWSACKAGLLLEIANEDEATRLVRAGLARIRETSRIDGNLSLAAPSREGWMLWLALALENSSWSRLDATPAFRRWKQLATLHCDAQSQKRDILDRARKNPEQRKGPLFDLGARHGESINFSDRANVERRAAHRGIRLCEVAGLPPVAAHTVIAADILSLSAENLAKSEFCLSARLSLRFSNSEDDSAFNHIWSRCRIATASSESIDDLAKIASSAIEYSFQRAFNESSHSTFWVTRLRVAIEALSRLVLRLPTDRGVIILRQALDYYRNADVADHFWLRKPTWNLMSRAWESLPGHIKTDLVLDILKAPIAGIDGYAHNSHAPRDAGDLLFTDNLEPPSRTSITEPIWNEVMQLILRGLRGGRESRERAASRLASVANWDLLTASESNAIAIALWNDYPKKTNTLPSNTRLFDWVFLTLPEPEIGIAKDRFREKWLGEQKFDTAQSANEYLWQLGNSLRSLEHRNRKITLTNEELLNVIDVIEKWVDLPYEDHPFIDGKTRDGVIGLEKILLDIDIPSPLAKRVFKRAIFLSQTKTPAYRLYAGLSKAMPDSIEELATSMRMGLASDTGTSSEEAVVGLQVWLRACSDQISFPTAPADLVQELGVIIATRRKGALIRALQVVRWIFESGSEEQQLAIAKSTLHGLTYLAEELRYDREHTDTEEELIPLLRWGCAHLALAMAANGFDNEPAVQRWAEVARDDPLPEVRHAQGNSASRATPDA